MSMGALARIGPSESQAIADAMILQPVTLYRGLRTALRDFREAWQEGVPIKLHEHEALVEDGDALGGPAMTERFKAFVFGVPRNPMRGAVRHMADAGLLADRVGSRFLFALACRDFDVRAAGLSMHPPLMPEFAPWYAERAVRRAFEVIEIVERERQRGRYVQRPCAHAGCDTLTTRELCEVHRVVQ